MNTVGAMDDEAPLGDERPAGAAQPAMPIEPAEPAEPVWGPPGAAGPAALIEVLDRDGRARQAFPVRTWPLRIGRAIDNDVVLDDPHVAAHHAAVEQALDGTLQLRVLPGRNGMRSGRRPLPAGGEPVPLAALALPAAKSTAASAPEGSAAPQAGGPIDLLAGHTRLRLRLAGEALELERELPDHRFGQRRTLGLALLLWLWILAEQAIALDPGHKAADWLPPVLGVPVALAGWCLVWGLASKLFQHRFEFWPHLAVVVPGLLAIEVATFALQWASALSGWPGFSRTVTAVNAGIALYTLWGHVRLVLPQHRRALGWATAGAYLAGGAILLGLNQQRNERWFTELYSHVLPPPALMWHRPAPPDAFVQRTERLKPGLDKRAAEAAAEQKDRGDDDDE